MKLLRTKRNLLQIKTLPLEKEGNTLAVTLNLHLQKYPEYCSRFQYKNTCKRYEHLKNDTKIAFYKYSNKINTPLGIKVYHTKMKYIYTTLTAQNDLESCHSQSLTYIRSGAEWNLPSCFSFRRGTKEKSVVHPSSPFNNEPQQHPNL